MPNTKKDYKKFCDELLIMAKSVQSELGGGFVERHNQAGLSIEFKNNNIEYMREANLEIYYKNHPIGIDTPDFIILSAKKPNKWNFNIPLIIETKVANAILDDHRFQLRGYLVSVSLNQNKKFQKTTKGAILKFPKSDNISTEIKYDPSIEIELWEFRRIKNDFIQLYQSFL